MTIPFEKSLAIDGIFVASCPKGDCHYRKGEEWFTGRLLGYRPPVLRKSLDRDRIRTVYLSAVERKEFFRELDEFRKGLSESKR